jgi:hypothetical protein
MAIANITNNILTDSGVATSSLLTTSAAASTYLALAGGTLTGPLSGTSATFTSATETRGNIRTTFPSDNSYYSIFSNDGALTLDTYGVGGYMNFKILGSSKLSIASTGAATFSSSVEAGGGFISNNDSNTPVGFYKLKPSSVTTARWWRITSDNIVYGDFSIAQSAANSDASYSNKLYFNATGAATFSSTLGINGVADNVKASTYSPTLTGVLNYTSGSGNICTFSRIANIVTVFFDINVNATAVLSKTECFISLPIPSTFTTFVGVGSGVGDVSSGYIPVLAAYGGGTNIVISFYSPATSGTYVYRGSFSYEVT